MRITAYGHPAAQGSKRHLGNGVMVESSKRLRPWRQDVKYAAIDALELGHRFGTEPVTVGITFTFARPNNHSGTGRNAGVVKRGAAPFPSTHNVGDLDKMCRAILDALTDAGVFADDSQVVQLNAAKVWVGTETALDRPGAVIYVLPAGFVDDPARLSASHSRDAAL